MQNSSQQVRKAPFIYPEYLSQVKSKMNHTKSEEQGPILAAMNNHNLFLFPATKMSSSRTICGKLKHSDSSLTDTTAPSIESASIMTSPAAIPSKTQQQIAAPSAPQPPAQPLLYTTTSSSMYSSMFMPQGMPNLLPSALTNNFSYFLSRKMITPPPPPPSEDASPSMISPSRFLSSTESPRRRKCIPSSPISASSSTSPSSPFKNMAISPRVLLNTTNTKQSSNNNNNSTASNTASNNNIFQPMALPAEPPKIRARVKNNKARLANTKQACASCVCRDQNLVRQRKEIDHLKGIVKDLLVMSLEATNNENDDDSLEDLPGLMESSTITLSAKGDLLQVSELALTPGPHSFEEDPEDPLKLSTVSSSSAMVRMSHSLRIKQSFTRGSPTKKPKKIRHLRIQVHGKWGYYCGPVPLKDVPLVGCVLRFDNGDMYLGNMENSCLHGPGSYYPKGGGQVVRGTFVWNQLS